MNVLVVGSGGREHAFAWKAAQSPRAARVFVAPGNAGTEALADGKCRNVPIRASDSAALVAFARENAVSIAIIGPEDPLAAGLADDLRAGGIPAFGPSRAAAQIEASKAFAKEFMRRHGIPTARYAVFTDYYDAIRHLLSVEYPVVIKASGLAAGKGVIVPGCADDAEAAVRAIMRDRAFGAAGDQVVIEERLEGEEISLIGFCDGTTVRAAPPAQDHKRVRDGDEGPNTGGMGAYAPAPACPPALAAELTQSVLQRAVDGMRAEGHPFVGALFAGLMLTAGGPRVLEFNCRSGDPETEALMVLLDGDLLEIAEACAHGCLASVPVHWNDAAAACVVMASGGYPEKYETGIPIGGLERAARHALVFHAGTRRDGERVLTAGGRVLAVTGTGDDIAGAIANAYRGVEEIHFEGAHYRRDIGARALRTT